MTNIVLPRPSTFALSDGFGLKPNIFSKDNGTLVYERVPVFRSGTFRDSMGYQNTWEQIHMDQMVNNYNYLKDSGVYADVPVRDGHAGWIISNMPGNGVTVGWHTNLVVEEMASPIDGEKYHYLLADYEITDPRAREQINNGTWRNRSAEIGGYNTNAEAEFWPVYQGFAFVDTPAVEGLKFSGANDNSNGRRVYVMMGKGFSVSGTGTGSNDFVRPPQAFSLNGVATTDIVAVQNHINALETFQRETALAGRANFVNGLATANKISVHQVPGLQEFAATLDENQWAAFRKGYDTAAVIPGLAAHASGVTNPDNTAQQTEAEQVAAQYEVWQNIVAMHRMGGATAETIKGTESYKKLIAAGQTVQLP